MLLSKKEREFRKLYSDYYPLILNALFTRIGNVEDAEEICHDVFVNYYRKFEEVRDPRNWLFGTMKFCVSNYYRKKGMADQKLVNIENLEEDIHLGYENGFRDVRIVIHEAINNADNYKDEKERILFELIAMSNYTYDQAAKQLGMSKRQAIYKYRQVSRRIVSYLKERGISQIEDLL